MTYFETRSLYMTNTFYQLESNDGVNRSVIMDTYDAREAAISDIDEFRKDGGAWQL